MNRQTKQQSSGRGSQNTLDSIQDLAVAENSREHRFFHKRDGRIYRQMDIPRDGHTEGRTDPLIETRSFKCL